MEPSDTPLQTEPQAAAIETLNTTKGSQPTITDKGQRAQESLQTDKENTNLQPKPTTSKARQPYKSLQWGILADPKILGLELFAKDPSKYHDKKQLGKEIRHRDIKFRYSNPAYDTPEMEQRIEKHL